MDVNVKEGLCHNAQPLSLSLDLWLFCFSLIRDGRRCCGHCLCIPKIAFADGVQIGIQVIKQRDTCGDIQLQNFLVRDVIKVFNERAKAVPVGRDDDFFPLRDLWFDEFFPVGNDAVNGIREAFTGRDFCRGKIGVSDIKPWVPLIIQR